MSETRIQVPQGYKGDVEERLAINRAAAMMLSLAGAPARAGGGGSSGFAGGPCEYHPPMPMMGSPLMGLGLAPAMPLASMSMMASGLGAMRMPFGKII